MPRLDALSAAALALLAGVVYAGAAVWLAGLALDVAWPGWYAAWAEQRPALAMRVWDAGVVVAAFVLPAAVLAWLLVGPGRLPDWRYALLAPLPMLVWTLVLPVAEGQGPRLAAEVLHAPLASALQMAGAYLSVPFFAWVWTATGLEGSRRRQATGERERD